MVRNKTARRRYLGAATAVVVAGAVTMGFLGSSSAIAEGSEKEIVFSGSCGALGAGLGNNSEPDKGSLTVTSGDKVTFTNNLGTKGTLHIGAAESTVEKGESKTVTLSNSTEAKMSPKCLIMPEDRSEKTTIKVKPRIDEHDGTDNGNGGGSSNGGGGSDNGDDSSSNGGSGDNGSTAGGADKPDSSPNGGKNPSKSKADGKAGNATDGDENKEDGAATGGGSDSGDSDDAAKVDAANKVSTESSASALLAALAALCLAGVGFAALRTFITSRTAARAA